MSLPDLNLPSKERGRWSRHTHAQIESILNTNWMHLVYFLCLQCIYCNVHYRSVSFILQIDSIGDVCISKFIQTQAHDVLHNLEQAQTQSDTNAPRALVDLKQ